MRKTVLLSILLAAAVSVSAGDGVPETVDPAQIPNYKKVTPTLAAAGQPTAEVLPKLGALGFKTVINLRMPNEDQPANERALVEAQGLRYVSVPVTSSSLSQADVDAVAKVLDDTHWNISRAAAILGINRTTLYNKIRVYELGKRPMRTKVGV